MKITKAKKIRMGLVGIIGFLGGVIFTIICMGLTYAPDTFMYVYRGSEIRKEASIPNIILILMLILSIVIIAYLFIDNQITKFYKIRKKRS